MKEYTNKQIRAIIGYMLYVVIFLIELFALFMLSKTLTNCLFGFFHKTTKSKKISIYLMSVFFLPGTFIHELSHALMAIVLRVNVGKMEFMPKLIDNNLKLGSVQVAKSDPIRRFLIGIAPFLFGAGLIIGTFFYAVQNNLFSYPLLVIVISYIVFEIGNTMFSSKKDMEGSIELLIALICITLVFYFVGLRIPEFNPNSLFSNPLIKQTFQKTDLYLAVPIMIDLIVILMFKLAKR